MRRDALPNADAWDRAIAGPTSATCSSIRTSPEIEIVEVPARPVPSRRGRRFARGEPLPFVTRSQVASLT